MLNENMIVFNVIVVKIIAHNVDVVNYTHYNVTIVYQLPN